MYNLSYFAHFLFLHIFFANFVADYWCKVQGLSKTVSSVIDLYDIKEKEAGTPRDYFG